LVKGGVSIILEGKNLGQKETPPKAGFLFESMLKKIIL